MLMVWVSGVVALKPGILGKVVAPVMAAVRVCAILKIYKLHGSQITNCSSLLYSLHKPRPLILLLTQNLKAHLCSLQAKWLQTGLNA